ncbi:MAG TPA: S1 RNA-binding domain-containing protein [Pseudonocardiaceae bacterium]|nr:S1 RNA-binding domain-containing protein [Pseudonocardiaceae bacterium]
MTNTHEPVALAVWQRFLADHADGGVITGRVVSVQPFGAFVEVAEGIHGLLPIVNYRTTAPDDGATVDVRIENVDLARRRMSLTLA